ncbi:MAG: VWA domain-containing protein, partial [Acidobacteria bacterium]|nr:VWA domain-containing protein [Acidobacteriota bacterium]
SFETDVTIPDLRKTPLRMSSVVLANQRVPANPAATKKGLHPLLQNQQELVPNITHVFTQDQHLYLQYEVYDAAHQRKGGTVAATGSSNALDALLGADAGAGASGGSNAPQPKPSKDAVHVLTNIEFLQGNTKVYESKQVVANELTAPDRKAVIFQIDLPLQSLKPGFYTCQVNIIDDNAGNFAFPRWPILVKEAQQPAASPASTPSQTAPSASPSGH